MVAVNGYDESADTVRRFTEANHIEHTVLLKGGAVAKEEFGVRVYPTSFLIDAKGRLVRRWIGFDAQGFAELRGDIDRLLAEPPEGER